MPDKPLLETTAWRIKQTAIGPMIYPHHDTYLGRSLDHYGEFAQHQVDTIASFLQPGMTVLDIGANIGALTVPMARAVGPSGLVIAIEAQRQLFHALCGNVALNDLHNVHALCLAAGGEPGEIRVPQLDMGVQNSFGSLSLRAQDAGSETVPVVPIDALGIQACQFIKVDVEGMEAEVVRGAAETIGRLRPTLYVENDRRNQSAELLSTIFGLGYRAYWHATPLFRPNNFAGEAEDIFPALFSLDVICVHRDGPWTAEGFDEVSGPQDWPAWWAAQE